MFSPLRWMGMIWATLASVAPGDTVPLAAPEGHCEFVLAVRRPGDQFYLIVGSLADAARATRISVRTETDGGPEFLPMDRNEPDRVWKARVDLQARFLERQRRQRATLEIVAPCASPPASKSFHLFTGARDLENPANYQEVRAELHGVGRHGQIYVDRDDKNLAGLDATVAEALRIFDYDLYPWTVKNLGHVLDVDRDGRFTILLTGRLGKMQEGASVVDGFVRGSDFFRDLPPPFSNRCDMLYLNAALKPGPHLRTVLTHEFTHAVTFCEHALSCSHGEPTNLDEESWLSEGLSHLIENRRGCDWSNLDWRISSFLSRPEHFSLVVPDYFAAGQWRNPGLRGAAYLFLRSCTAHTDADMPRRLIQSPLRGIANLEGATGMPFPDLFRQSAVDLLDRKNYGFLDADRKGPLLCGPRFQSLPLDRGHGEIAAAGSAAAFFLLHSPAGTYARVKVACTGPVQMTLVRLPRDLPRLALHRIDAEPQVELRAVHGEIMLRGAAWEDEAGQQLSTGAGIAGSHLDCGERLIMQLPRHWGASALVLKVLGEDAQGRPVVAWITLPGR
jgi:hypothetical protein